MFWRRRGAVPAPGADDDGSDPFLPARMAMVRDQIERRGLTDPDLLRAFATVPRHRFVSSREAYADEALPLAEGQTISQPFVVAMMTAIARPGRGWRGARVLEIGTGSGYQAAILAELGAEVVSVERHASLSATAAEALRATGYAERVQLVVGDGSRGYAAGAPYDTILVTAAGPVVPEPLRAQLSPDGGKLVLPLGGRGHQELTVVERRGDEYTTRRGEPVVFVPLIGEWGFEE